MRAIKKGSTDQSVVIRIIDSTDFTPETSVDYNTSGIDLWYRRDGATKTSITEATLASLDAAHSDGGIEPIGDGYYRLDLPDAAVATGANGVMIGGTVTGMIVIGCYVHLVDYDPQDAVRMGCTALPNAAADAAGGLPISDAGGLDLDAQVKTAIDAILVDTGTTLDSLIKDVPTVAEFEARTLPAADYVVVTDTIAGVTLVTTTTNLTNAPTNGDLTATMKTSVQTAATASLNAYDPPTATEMTSAFTEIKGASWATTDTLEAIRDRGDAAWVTATGFSTHSAADVKTAIEAAGSHLTLILEDTGTTLPATLDTIDNFLDTEIAAILGDTDELQKAWVDGGRLDLLIDAIKAKTDLMLDAAAIRTALEADGSKLDVLYDDWLNGGRLDLLLDAAAAGGDVFSTEIPGAYAVGTAGYIIGTNLDAKVSEAGGGAGDGTGADEVTITWTSNGFPVGGGDVWITTDPSGDNVVAGTLQTNDNGQATFMLDDGSVYFLWGQRSGVNAIRGERFVAVAD